MQFFISRQDYTRAEYSKNIKWQPSHW